MRYRIANNTDLWKDTKFIASFHSKTFSVSGFDEGVFLADAEMKEEQAFVIKACNEHKTLRTTLSCAYWRLSSYVDDSTLHAGELRRGMQQVKDDIEPFVRETEEAP